MRRARIAGALLWLAFVAGCDRGEAPTGGPPAEVFVATAQIGTLPDRRDFVGNVRAVNSVDVRARVRGYLKAKYFDEGALVEEGDLLYRIDSRDYEAKLAAARAELARARANANRAKQDFARAEELYDGKIMSTSTLDARRADRDAAQADVAAAEAAVTDAELSLSYCTVRAPISGRIGRSLVDPGNLVGESGQDTVLARIVQLDPIYVDFATSEDDSIPVPRKGDEATVRVRLRHADDSPYPEEGRVDYVDPAVDSRTGTVGVRAVVSNPDGVLKPGEFVRVQAIFPEQNALLVPQRTILEQQGGSYVLLVNADDVVEIRPVQLGAATAGLQQIRSGLRAGDRVIADGTQKARPGQKVTAKPLEEARAGVLPGTAVAPDEPEKPGS